MIIINKSTPAYNDYNMAQVKRMYTTYNWSQDKREIDAEFFIETPDKLYFMDDVLSTNMVNEHTKVPPFNNPITANFVTASKYKPYDYQEEMIKPVLEAFQKKGIKRYMFNIDTGGGKTLTACNLLIRNNKRFTILLPAYVDKWISDIQENIVVSEEDNDLYVVSENHLLSS